MPVILWSKYRHAYSIQPNFILFARAINDLSHLQSICLVTNKLLMYDDPYKYKKYYILVGLIYWMLNPTLLDNNGTFDIFRLRANKLYKNWLFCLTLNILIIFLSMY